jgi:hypothetical protein
MPERITGKKIKTLGELRKFINEDLKDLQDNYELSIDGGFQYDVTLVADCSISYSEKSLTIDCDVEESALYKN